MLAPTDHNLCFSHIRIVLVLLLIFHTSLHALAQSITINGVVRDAESGDPLPFVNVVVNGTQLGAITDFNGAYHITLSKSYDSISASYIGYHKRTKPIGIAARQTIDFQLTPRTENLEEVIVKAGENPAWPIMRAVMDHKKQNDKRSLDYYEYESYSKVELSIDQISDKFRKRKMMQPVIKVLDSLDQIAGEDGQPVLPLFISETLSAYYIKNSPESRKEKILNTNITGFSVDDGSFYSQFIGTSFQEYNFYRNWMRIVDKDFVSPLNNSWRLYYEYYLMDSLEVDGELCYKIEVYPKSEQDLAFEGTMWITKQDYALKQIDVSVDKNTNLNYIEKIKVQQQLSQTEAGPWLPDKTRVTIDMSELSQNSAGVLAKFYVSNKNWVVNKPHEAKFYQQAIEVSRTAHDNDRAYWDSVRHEPLSASEEYVHHIIDTLKQVPVVRTYVDIFKIAVTGYKQLEKIDAGPYLYTYAHNDIEGSRFRLGLKTNTKFSPHWFFKGFAAYGTADRKFKGGGSVSYIPESTLWSKYNLGYKYDLEQVGLLAEDLQGSNIFYAFTRWGDLNLPFYSNQVDGTIEKELFKGFMVSGSAKWETFDPLYDFNFYHPSAIERGNVYSHYTNMEVSVAARYAHGEIFVYADNERMSMGTRRAPIISARYTKGLRGVLDSDFNYDKVKLNVSQSLRMGLLGTSKYEINASKIFSPLPYPLLEVHIGNESPFFTEAAYNLMNVFEFVSDAYAELAYHHHFEGFILNRIPLMKKLKWRLVGSFNVLYGGVSDDNKALIPVSPGETPFHGLGHRPYIEAGYGIENIFKVGRIDFFHRLSYLENPATRKFGVKVSFQFIL